MTVLNYYRTFSIPSKSALLQGAAPEPAVLSKFSLSTKDYRWLHDEAWEAGDLSYFATRRSEASAQIFTPPPFQYSRPRLLAAVLGRWLLKDLAGQHLGFIEAHVFLGGLTTGHILFSLSQSDAWSADRCRGALGLIVSGVMISRECASITLLPVADADADLLANSGWGDTKSLWTPDRISPFPKARQLEAGRIIRGMTVDQFTWWRTEIGSAAQTTLAYLERRVNRPHRIDFGRKRRPSLFNLFFRRDR